MRRFLLTVAGLVLLGTVLLVGCGSNDEATAANGQALAVSPELLASLASNDSQRSGIWVTGEGEVTAVPDVAVLTLGIEAQELTVAEAQGQAIAAMNQIMAVLTAQGVADKDIQTQRYSIDKVERWDEDSKEPITVGYRVTNIVRVKIREIDNAGIIIDAVSEAGGDLTRVESLGFTVDDPTSFYDEARGKAMTSAIAKAEQLASLANVELGKAVYISESSGYIPTRYPAVAGFSESLDSRTPISPGELEIRLTVEIGYVIQ